MSGIKFASFNCRGIGDFKKRKDVFSYLRKKDFNICLLQDIHCRKIGVPYFRNAWGTDVVVAPYANNARGVAILTKNIDVTFSDTCIDEHGNFIITRARISDTVDFCLVNVYGPNSDEPDFYENLAKNVNRLVGEENMPTIIAGDFNLTLNQSLDNFNYRRENNTRARKAVKSMMAANGLIDIYRERNPEDKRYTWRVGSPVIKQARLDMFLISSCLEGYVEKTDIQPGYRSDHSIITLTLDMEQQKRGRGLFKFNASLLKDSSYVSLVKNTIQSTVCEYALPIYEREFVIKNHTQVELTISSSLFFEVLMLTLRRETVSFGIQKKKEERRLETQLEISISEMERMVDETGSQDISNELQRSKKKLEQIREKKLRGSLVRSRSLWRENSEKPSKYFLTLEKRRYESKRIPCLRTTEGIKRSQPDILKALEDFFRKRFSQAHESTSDRECDKYLAEVQLSSIAASDRKKLEEPITLSELGATLSKMKNGTAPGSDGFSVEFYKFFWADLKNFFKAMCIESLSNGILPQTLKEGIIVLLPKPNKPRDLLKSYRPITLLNVCYKIISGTIANRLKENLQKIIDSCQTAYLKGRFIGDNIRTIYDLVQLMKCKTVSGILLSLDIEAAFDSVNWSFIQNVLEARGFPSNIIGWFNTMYYGSFSRVLYNGHLSGKINLSRSCRQGDALSCYLFILVMDVLAHKIKQNVDIKGIRICNKEHKVLMYADDTVCLIEPSRRSISELFKELGWFAKFSGLSPNLDKTQAMWIGASFRDTEKFQREVTLNWQERLKILGIVFENCLHSITDVYAEKVNEIKREIRKWMFRNISYEGKVTVIKSLLISKISYLFMSIPNPSQSVVSELNKIMYNFLWHGKREKVGRNSLIKDKEEGGLGMIDLESYIRALKITWVRRYITKDGIWRTLVDEITGNGLEFWQLGRSALKKKVSRVRNQFWKEVLSALSDFKEIYKPDIHQLSACGLFFSEITKFKCSWIREWYIKGVRTLSDLLTSEGTLMKYEELKQVYNIRITFLDYQALITSLPAEWRNFGIGKKLVGPVIDPCIGYILEKTTGTSHITKILIESKTKRFKNLWERKWESRIMGADWKNVYATLRDTPMQYRTIRYKVITRILGTNSLLEKMSIRNTDACEHCAQREDIEHKFWYCLRVQNFWNDMKEWFLRNQLSNFASKICIDKVILGGEKSELLNHIVSIRHHQNPF